MSAHYHFSLSHISSIFSHVLDVPRSAKVGLVLEGGGQRSSFAAGVTDAFLDHHFYQFSHVVGVSAGAQVGACFSSGARGLARKIMLDVSTDTRFYRMMNWFANRPILNLDWYFDTLNHSPIYRIPTREKNAAKMHIVTSHRDTYQPEYFRLNSQHSYDALKASSAIPFFYEPGVEVAGNTLVDGGVAHPIPTSKAVELGCDLIINIRLSPENSAPRPIFSKYFHKFLERTYRDSSLPEIVAVHEANYRRDCEYIQSPPKGVSVIEISPPEHLQSTLLGSSRAAMQQDYKTGYDTGVLFMNSWAGANGGLGHLVVDNYAARA